jgi:anti-sigma regulatory factor (Ser/Thr protein kinase)
MTSDRRAGTPPYRPIRIQVPVSPLAQRHARTTLRRALNAWNLEVLAGDAELLVSELVANAAEHGDGTPIDLTIGRQQGPNGEPGILCQVTDAATALPQPRSANPDSERGRGLHVVAALATDSGVTKNRRGKTAWFTLNDTQELTRDGLKADHEAEASP